MIKFEKKFGIFDTILIQLLRHNLTCTKWKSHSHGLGFDYKKNRQTQSRIYVIPKI
jgi:hypothetical protein